MVGTLEARRSDQITRGGILGEGVKTKLAQAALDRGGKAEVNFRYLPAALDALFQFALFSTASISQPPMKEFYQDFATSGPTRPVQASCRTERRDTSTTLRRSRTASRFLCPSNFHARRSAFDRFWPRDFEITAGYEILHDERPPDGNGMGFIPLFCVIPTAMAGHLSLVAEGRWLTRLRRTTGKDGMPDSYQ